MSTGDLTLIPKERYERFAFIRTVLEEERRHRVGMRERHPDKADYWQRRIDVVDEALDDLDALEGV